MEAKEHKFKNYREIYSVDYFHLLAMFQTDLTQIDETIKKVKEVCHVIIRVASTIASPAFDQLSVIWDTSTS